MAANLTTTSGISASLQRQYDKKYFDAFQNDFTPFLDELGECPDRPVKGAGWFFEFYLSSPKNVRGGAEGGDMADVVARSVVEGKVLPWEAKGTIHLSELLKNMATADASYAGGELNRSMRDTTKDMAKFTQKNLVLSHGTNRLALVQDATVGTNAFVAKLNESIFGLGENERIDVYDTDSGGSIQLTNRQITAINRATRTVTFSGAIASLTAGHSVYRAGDYGTGVNGVRGLVDDGTYADLVGFQSRTTNPKLKAHVDSNGGTVRTITPDMMRDMCDRIWHTGGVEIDRIRCNSGILRQYFSQVNEDRVYNVNKSELPKAITGNRKGDAIFAYDDLSITIDKDPNFPAREMYFLALKDTFYKHTTKKLGWLNEGGSILRLAPGSVAGTYATSWIAIIYQALNMSCRNPLGNGVIRDGRDIQLAGDAAA